MAFNCNETPTLLSLDSIVRYVKEERSSFVEDPESTIWYIDADNELAVMVHPAFCMMFYNSDMGIEGMCDLDCVTDLSAMLDNYGLDTSSMVWREIGIDQIDYHFVN
ncbi:hypothetical protein F404_gp130 [Vibrio phage pVp-1]|uniref:Uncharacterized protein n=1 Tax=Vibrio phage pVp-1 TaxID=1150989 RepID=H6WXM1_9CAUD|nr:hypothetical protein F404_gp130 [Vibrio phage pVp-1]AFB83987.1 hypothetical protein pVp-1_0130 [Vibrio phage pVp-1]